MPYKQIIIPTSPLIITVSPVQADTPSSSTPSIPPPPPGPQRSVSDSLYSSIAIVGDTGGSGQRFRALNPRHTDNAARLASLTSAKQRSTAAIVTMLPDPPARYPATPTRPLTAAMPPDTPDRRSACREPAICLSHATLPKTVKTVPCRHLPARAACATSPRPDRRPPAESSPLTPGSPRVADDRPHHEYRN
ncbi:hypothetical protein Bbelb_433340 [Branchiostoma belcheri]|nr:hypothetical protein Bbelb_433340 [Branchiostoma belcheri]